MNLKLTTNEAASYIGFSPNTLNNSRSSGILGGKTAPPFQKIGRSVRYDKSELEKWLNQFKSQTSTSVEAA